MSYRVWGKKTCGQLGLTAFCAAGLFLLLFGMLDLYPAGQGSILMTDLYSQYVPLLYRFYDVASGEKNLFLDFFVSGGANLYADTVNELANPVNYLLFLFGREKIYLAVNVLFFCYGVLAALSAHVFLLALWPGQRKWNTLLSLCYAFSGYLAYNFQIIKWMLFPVLFPLFALALLRLARKEKGGLYALLLAWQLLLSIQLGFMALLFVLFSGGLYALFLVPKKGRLTFLGRLAWYTLAGILLSGAVLLPSFAILLSSARAGENLSWLGVMKRHGLDDLFERLFQIAQPALMAFLVFGAVSFLRQKKGGKGGAKMPADLRFLLALNAFLWITVLAEPVNLLWHMGSYVCFPVRYAYMVLLAQVCLAKRLWAGRDKEREASPGKNKGAWIRLWFAALGTVTCCILGLGLTFGWQERITQAFSSLAISRVCPAETGMVCAVLALLFGAGLCALSAGMRRRQLFSLAAGFTALCLNLFVILPPESAVRQENLEAYERMTLLRREKGEDVWARDARLEEGLPLNAALVDGQGSLSGYFPTADSGFARTMEGLGYLVPWVATQDVGGTTVSAEILRSALVFDHSPGQLGLTGKTVLGRQESLTGLAAGQSLMEVFSGTELLQEEGAYVLPVEGKRTVWLDAGAAASQLRIRVNGDEIEIPESTSAYSPHRLVLVGTFENEEPTLSVTDRAGNPLPAETVQIGLLDDVLWQETVRMLEEAGQEGRADTTRIVPKEAVRVDSLAGKIRVELPDAKEGQTLFLPFAALDGWRCEKNGERAEVKSVLGGFLGVSLSGGENVLVFSFRPPWLEAGIVCTALGAGLLLFLLWMPGRRGGKTAGAFWRTAEAAQKAAGQLYKILWLAGLAGIYVLPMIGLFGYMAGKLLSFW